MNAIKCRMCEDQTCEMCLAASTAAWENTTVSPGGAISSVGPAALARFKAFVVRSGLSLAAKGIKISRGRSALKCAREDYGVKARTAAKALVEFEGLLRERGLLKEGA